MKKLFIISLLTLPVIVNAQVDIGKIEVCSQYTVTLMFATDIEFVIFGNNPLLDIMDGAPEYENYAIFERGKTLIIKANKENIARTSINVKTADGTLFYGFLEYKENTTLFHDFTGKAPMLVEPSITTCSDDVHIDKKNDYEIKLEHVMNQSIEYTKFGLISGKLTLR